VSRRHKNGRRGRRRRGGRGGGRARGRVALETEAATLHDGEEAKAAAMGAVEAVAGEVAEAVVVVLVETLGASMGVGGEKAQEEAVSETVGAAGVGVAPSEKEGTAEGDATPRPLAVAGGDGVAEEEAQKEGKARSAAAALTVGGAEGVAEGEPPPPLGEGEGGAEGVAPARGGALAVEARAGVGVPAPVAQPLAVEVGAHKEAAGASPVEPLAM
jgi:hypothetical protein